MSRLDAEIAAQPEAVARMLDAEAGRAAELGSQLAGVSGVLIAARGSSDNAARYAQYLLGVRAGLPVALATPSIQTLYGAEVAMDGLLVVGVSQSGQSPDIVAVLAQARAQGRPTVAVTNDAASPLAAQADWVLGLHVTERSVAATGTYVCSLAALALLAAGLRGDAGDVEVLRAVPEALAATLEAAAAPAAEAAGLLVEAQRSMVVGRGFHYATAFEVALKVKELSGMVAEPVSSADFRHGPIAVVDEGFPVVLVAPSGRAHGDVADLVEPLAERGARLVAISDVEALLGAVDVGLPVAGGLAEWASPLVAVAPGQLLAVALARARGGDPDDPPGLAKVTRTT